MLWLLLMLTLYTSKISSFRLNLVSNLRKMTARNVENPNHYKPHDLRLPILYEDDHMMVINKPANIRSVPGVDMHRTTHKFGVKRTDEWLNAVKSLIGRSSDEAYNNLIIAIASYQNVPRRLDKFTNFLIKRYKVTDQQLIEKLYKEIEEEDKLLNHYKVEDVPLELISAFDVAQHMAQTKMYIIHRLDMETSGIILFAKTLEASIDLCKQFREREVKKVYIAKVAGKVDKNLISISLPMGPDLNNRPLQIIDHENGKDALTLVRVIDDPHEYALNDELFANHKNEATVSGSDIVVNTAVNIDTSLVELRPHTGRTHQLRVHMSHIGHPMLGDTIYAPIDVISAANRLCLHARSITLKHPITKEDMVIDSIRDCKEETKKRKATSEALES